MTPHEVWRQMRIDAAASAEQPAPVLPVTLGDIAQPLLQGRAAKR